MDIAIVLMIGVLNFAAHWFPWSVAPILVDKQGLLKRVPAYVFGSLTIFGGFVHSVLSYPQSLISPRDAVMFLGVDMVAAGLGVMASRFIGWLQDYRALQGDVMDHEQNIQR